MNTKEMIEVMQAHLDGKNIEYSPADSQKDWKPVGIPSWNWDAYDYRVAPEPKKEGRWERVEIIEKSDGYGLAESRYGWVRIPDLQNIPGYGGIDYRSPFNPKVIVRSTVPLMFSPDPNSDLHFSVGIEPDDRPGIPVAAWFWLEGEK